MLRNQHLYVFLALFFLIIGVLADYDVILNATDPSLTFKTSATSSSWLLSNRPACGKYVTQATASNPGIGVNQTFSVSLTFTGTAVSLDVMAYNDSALVFVKLDDVGQDFDAAARGQILTDCNFVTLFSRTGLENKEHSIIASLDSPLTFFNFVAFRYTVKSPPDTMSTSTPPSSSLATPFEIAAVATGASALFIVIVGFAVLYYLYRKWQRSQAQFPSASPSAVPHFDPASLPASIPQFPSPISHDSATSSAPLGRWHSGNPEVLPPSAPPFRPLSYDPTLVENARAVPNGTTS